MLGTYVLVEPFHVFCYTYEYSFSKFKAFEDLARKIVQALKSKADQEREKRTATSRKTK